MASSKLKMVSRIALISLTAMSLLASSVIVAESEPLINKISLREHKTGDRYNPYWLWSKPNSSIVRMTSRPRQSLGNGYMFFVIDRDYIHGKYIRITWQADTTWSAWSNSVRVYDGSYDRSSDTDFPPDSYFTKGNGRLQTGLNHMGDFGPVTEEFQVDTSGAALGDVTIIIYSRDAWVEQSGWLEVDLLEINTGAGGSGTRWRALFNEGIHMERTGSYGDYGYIDTFMRPPDFVVPEYPVGTISAIVVGLISILVLRNRKHISVPT